MSSHRIPARRLPIPYVLAGLTGLLSETLVWHQRSQGRAQLRSLEQHRLDDIGLSPDARDREVRKPFWRR